MLKDDFTQEELAKLPKWAQSKAVAIQRERERLEDLIDDSDNITDDLSKDGIHIESHSLPSRSHFFESDDVFCVSFRKEGTKVRITEEDDGLSISWNSRNRMAILPEVSNSVRLVKLKKD